MSKKTYNISKISAQKSASDFDGLQPVCNFLESSNSKRKKRYAQILVFLIFIKSGQIVVKLWKKRYAQIIQEILVLINNYFSFLTFGQTVVKLWSNLVKLWSNYGQTTYSRNISVTK